ncbi:MAG: hypothetical protein HFJ37_05865, partial [Clostridia bacterium]|nr:hypothetical protein [Clostridia bacterium]
MEENKVDKIFKLLDTIPVTPDNEEIIYEIREDLANKNYIAAVGKIEQLSKNKAKKQSKTKEDMNTDIQIEKNKRNIKYEDNIEEEKGIYPKKLSDKKIERIYIGLLLNDPKLIVKYYFLYEECQFEDDEILNIYKSILFTEGGPYTPEKAKSGFNFAKDTEKSYRLKSELKKEAKEENYNMEKIYINLKKLFVLRKNYLAIPIKEIQDKVVEIRDYILYDKMTVEEVANAVVQVNDTEKFKRAVISKDLTDFLQMGDNNLTNGLPLPFPILTSVFKGIRKGETMAFSMPSNSGKSRFTIDIAAHTALVHKKKVLIISNEMSEEKMRLCLITTIINNPAIQELHGQKI